MRERVVVVHERTNYPAASELLLETGEYETLSVSVTASGAPGVNLVLRPVEARSNYTRLDGVALIAPGADGSLIVGIGAGLDIGSPPPAKLRVALDAPGGFVTLRVEATRYEDRPDDQITGGFASMRSAIDDLGKLMAAVLDALRHRR